MSLFFHLFFLCLLFLTLSCDSNVQYDFKSSEDALTQYESFYRSANAKSLGSAEKLTAYIDQWHELSDTVYHFILKDPSFTAHTALSMRYNAITDSVRMSLLNCVRNCTLRDVAYVKLHTSRFDKEGNLDSVKQSASSFFSELDKSPIYNNVAKQNVSQYSHFLRSTMRKGIKSQSDLLAFIKAEDIHFRTFLAHIDECSTIGMTEVTNATADICSSIYKMASQKNFHADETLVYMSMRTNRRLVLNAKVCYEALRQGEVKDSRRANAYLWMILQPYLSIDSLGIAMLTPSQAQDLTDMAKTFPSIISKLNSKHLIDKEVTTKLPQQLMRLYISTL